MPNQVQVGVIGTSWFADGMHLPNLKSHPQAEIAAICGRKRDRAEEMAKKYGIPLVFTDYREMIEKGDLHAVEVITPDDLHYPMAMDALDAGLHFVYVGNVPGHAAQNTVCPACAQTVIERKGYRILLNRLREGRCPCGESIPGLWA